MHVKQYFATGGVLVKSPNSKAFRIFPRNCCAAPAPLAALSDTTHLKPNVVTGSLGLCNSCLARGINGRKVGRSGNGKIPRCPDGAEYEVAIPAVPLRSLPSVDVKGKPEESETSHGKYYDEGHKIAKITDHAVHQKEELWKHESDKLSAVLAEAKEFINLFDSRNSTVPVKDSRESKDQPPSLESDAFHPRTSIGEQKVMMETVEGEKREREIILSKSVMLQNLDKSFSGKRLKVNGGISVVVQDEKPFGTDIMCEDSENEVCLSSPEEWNVWQRSFSHKECIKPSIGKLEKRLECRNVVEPQCEHDEAMTMHFVDDEVIATNDEPEYFENHNELINLEIVQHDHPQGRMVTQALKLFKEEYVKLLQENELELRKGKTTIPPHMEAAQRVKAKGMYVSTDKPFGHIPGIEIGDEFSFRAELVIVGLNGQFTPGIDYAILGGKPYATSVVNSGRYENKAKEHDILIYSGQGGNPGVSVNATATDQKPERGNLALMNSMEMGYPVRVIHKRKCLMESTLGMNNKRDYIYVYDGLYMVNRFWQERENPNYRLVFKFELQRLPGQPRSHGADVELGKKIQAIGVCDALHGKENCKVVNGLQGQPRSHGTNNKSGKQIQATEVCVLDDVSQGKENFKVRVVNGVDDERPLPFTYITNIVYPRWYQHSEPIGCNCIDGCSDLVQCRCVIKNGGEIPFTEKGAIMRAMPKYVAHECGPSCKCPPSCMNRVGQHGPHFLLEIFKTKSMGWGVRSRNYIMPGMFVCEYIGELLGEKEANQRIGDDEYLFDICHGKQKEDDFALDAAKCGNISRFINHSCEPNLFAKEVHYDNDDKRIPRIMFFASKRIPPGKELSYDYNYKKIRVRDANGNIKRKACHCGSHKCTGRLY